MGEQEGERLSWMPAVGFWAAVGLVTGILFSLYAFVVAVIGVLRFGAGSLGEIAGALGPIVHTYLVGGVLGGATVGVLRPLARWRLGAMLVGAVVAGEVYGLVSYMAKGQVDFVFASVCALAGGLPSGSISGPLHSGREVCLIRVAKHGHHPQMGASCRWTEEGECCRAGMKA